MPSTERYSDATRDWAEQWDCCWQCGKRGAWKHGLEIHHIVRGTSRELDDLATTAMLCHDCHEKEHFTFDHLGLWKMLALKQKRDPQNYDLARVCAARGRATTSITQAEVDAAKELGADG